MKKVLIILGLFLFATELFAFDRFYYQSPTTQNKLYRRPTYNNSYSNIYYSPYRYKKTNYNNTKRIQRNNRIYNLNKIKNNLLGWSFNRNNFNNGSLTGYSTPINSQFSDDFWKDLKHNSSCNTDLFSTPSSNGMYYRNGKWFNINKGASGKAGVRIIYD